MNPEDFKYSADGKYQQYIGSLPYIYGIYFMKNYCYIIKIRRLVLYNIMYFSFESFEDLIDKYKDNICYPKIENTNLSTLTIDEQKIILDIWNQYKDLL